MADAQYTTKVYACACEIAVVRKYFKHLEALNCFVTCPKHPCDPGLLAKVPVLRVFRIVGGVPVHKYYSFGCLLWDDNHAVQERSEQAITYFWKFCSTGHSYLCLRSISSCCSVSIRSTLQGKVCSRARVFVLAMVWVLDKEMDPVRTVAMCERSR